jgi:hypothetical protein
MVKVKFRRHYVDHEREFNQEEIAWKFVEDMDNAGTGFAAEIWIDGKRAYTRYRPIVEGWTDKDGNEVEDVKYRNEI